MYLDFARRIQWHDPRRHLRSREFPGLQPVSIDLLYPGLNSPPLKRISSLNSHTHIYNHMHMQQSFKCQMAKARTSVLEKERISGTHRVLMLPCCLLYSSVLPQHLYLPHSLVSQNMLSAIHNMHRSLLGGPIYIDTKLDLIHYMSWIWSVLPEHEDMENLVDTG